MPASCSGCLAVSAIASSPAISNPALQSLPCLYKTTDQINWLTTLDKVPYTPVDKKGRNALSVNVFPDENPMSYFQQWNMNIEKQVGGFMFEVGYAGSKGSHLQFGSYNANAIPVNLAPVAQGRRIAPYVAYPKYPNGVTINTWIGSSSYHSLQVKSERRFSAGLSYIAAFTWSKLIDVGQNGNRDPLNNRNLDRGVTTDSAPYRFTLAPTYVLPFGRGRHWMNSNRALDLALGGWET